MAAPATIALLLRTRLRMTVVMILKQQDDDYDDIIPMQQKTDDAALQIHETADCGGLVSLQMIHAY